MSRIDHPGFAAKVRSAEDAAAQVHSGDNVAMSGFTGAGHPKQVPLALARRMADASAAGRPMRVGVWTGASTAPELDRAIAEADGMALRMPYQSDPVVRRMINDGQIDFYDLHLSHVTQSVSAGYLGNVNVAVVEVSRITTEGDLVPSSSLGPTKTWLDEADHVILEVNEWQSELLDGMHDVYYGMFRPPYRVPIPLTTPGDRIGQTHLRCPLDKVVAVVPTFAPDSNPPFKAPDEVSRQIAQRVVGLLQAEVEAGRIPPALLPLQSGVGNVANAVLADLATAPLEGLTAYTEVIQDGMLDLLDSGKLISASATAFCLSPEGVQRFVDDAERYRRQIILRPQEISNHPEIIRRLGIIATNGLIEADLYGNVNSTHVMGTRMQNGIGGSGDFARNSYLTIFVTPSTAKGGAISAIVPMVSHVDHTEHDVDVLVTEWGLADLRGCAPRERARRIIDHCAHPDYRPALADYFERACRDSAGKHTPHLLGEALSWHQRYLDTGTMQPG